MTRRRHISFAGFLRAVTLLAWLVGFAWLLGARRYHVFISPDLGWLIVGGCILLLPLCVAAYFRLRTSAPPDPRQTWNRCGQTALLLLPLIYLVAGVSFGGLGAQAFEQRYVAGQRPTADSQREEFDPTDPDITVLELLDHIDRLVDRPVEIIGRVYHQPDLPPQEFILYRFLIVCCAADAVPIGVHVTWPGPPPPDDAWVRVEGTAALIEIDGSPGAHLNATAVDQIDKPEHPYLVP